MKINDKTNESKNVIETVMTSIDRYTNNKNGREFSIIVLKTNDGNFSNYESIWTHQNIDLEKASDSLRVRITYTTHIAKNGAEFKNFVSVEEI